VKVEVALAELKNVRLAIAFPHDSWVRPGVGDDLISRLAPHLPPLPIMLVSEGLQLRAYAAFQTREFLDQFSGAKLQRFEIDLSEEPEDEEELPF
jgi:hypothetical protein